MKKIETHFHTKESSFCGGVYAADGIELLKKHSYDAVIITDHFARYSRNYYPGLTHKRYVDQWLQGYNNAKSAGENNGIKVFLGMELTLDHPTNDYLIYGISKEILYANENIFALDEAGLKRFCDKNGLLVFQAHPFRDYIKLGSPNNLHGVEVHNGNPRQESNNHLAKEFAERHNLLKLSGSDFHQRVDAGRGGIWADRLPRDNKELLKMLRNRKYEIEKEIML